MGSLTVLKKLYGKVVCCMKKDMQRAFSFSSHLYHVFSSLQVINRMWALVTDFLSDFLILFIVYCQSYFMTPETSVQVELTVLSCSIQDQVWVMTLLYRNNLACQKTLSRFLEPYQQARVTDGCIPVHGKFVCR